MSKIAAITGASEGIGREFALQLAAAGYRVIAIARNTARLHELTKALNKSHPNNHSHIAADLKHPQQRAELFAKLPAHVDVFVNNAGIGAYGKFGEISYDELKDILQVNVDAVMDFSHRFLRQAKKGDALINVSSTLAFLPAAWASVYCGTKAFVTTFSEALWADYRPAGIYILNVCPGATTSKFHERAGGTVKRLPPAGMVETAEAVVTNALQALQRRKQPTLISGNKNKFAATVARFLPRHIVLKMMAGAN